MKDLKEDGGKDWQEMRKQIEQVSKLKKNQPKTKNKPTMKKGK